MLYIYIHRFNKESVRSEAENKKARSEFVGWNIKDVTSKLQLLIKLSKHILQKSMSLTYFLACSEGSRFRVWILLSCDEKIETAQLVSILEEHMCLRKNRCLDNMVTVLGANLVVAYLQRIQTYTSPH